MTESPQSTEVLEVTLLQRQDVEDVRLKGRERRAQVVYQAGRERVVGAAPEVRILEENAPYGFLIEIATESRQRVAQVLHTLVPRGVSLSLSSFEEGEHPALSY